MLLRISAIVPTLLFACLTLAHEGPHGPASQSNQRALLEKISMYQKQFKKNPSDLNALLHLGDSYEKLGRLSGQHESFAKAADYFQQILAFNPDHAGGLQGLCRTYLAQHKFHKGLTIARRLSETAPEDLQTLFLLGDAHFFLGNYAEAGAFFRQALKEEENLGTAARIAQLYESKGDYKNAYLWMNKALAFAKSDGNSEQAWVMTMLAELDLQTHKIHQSKKRFEQALALDSGSHYAQWRLAEIHMHQGLLQTARKTLHDLIHQHPRIPYMITYGKLWQRLDRKDRANFWFNKAQAKVEEEIQSGDEGHVRELVALWCYQGKHLDKALELAKKEYEEVRQDSESAEWLGWLYHLNGDSKKGVGYMNRALRLGFAQPRFMLRAALVTNGSGNPIRAALLFGLANKDGAFVNADLLKKAKSVHASIKGNPNLIRQQFQPQARK